ncbi:MAG: peroxiredoxin [Candidatus Omnitrophica bacterium CG11_big_fil_rev_8_21_14_0_20_42_13]|uniref:Peroxiredoxin n=1 Tax=Candidatus Ghiorseimicrobium undicola TaxID=1974746 RepID=A0A2H0LXH7_9BACT|nr:MAG: peroxiredoxin [Candidatus Omnitrophica bacterium CG11_big_fil_rev_8_21_14_0_20_42_13]
MKRYILLLFFSVFIFLIEAGNSAYAVILEEQLYKPGKMKSQASMLKVSLGDEAPDFTLPSIDDKNISLRSFRGRKNVVLSFIPAAWTPVCSAQWPEYNMMQAVFEDNDTVLVGISVDNIPTLYAWSRAMGGVWFSVLSDFWPHGEVADEYGVLRDDGEAERAIFLINKKGIIEYIEVYDINTIGDASKLIEKIVDLN